MSNDSSNILSYVNYNKMMDGTQELLTSDKWDVEFDRTPPGVYWPGDQFLKFRIKGVDNLSASLFPHQPLGEGVDIRGFEIPVQPGQIKMRNQPVMIKLIDYEDQSIYAFLNSWKMSCCNPVTQQSMRADQLRANLTFKRLNSQNQVVRSYKMINAMIGDTAYEDQFDGDRSLIGAECVITLVGMIFPTEFANIPESSK